MVKQCKTIFVGKEAKKVSALTEQVLLAQRGKDQDHLRTVRGISCSAKCIADRVFAHFVKHLTESIRQIRQTGGKSGKSGKLQTAFIPTIPTIPTIEDWQCILPIAKAPPWIYELVMNALDLDMCRLCRPV